MKKVYLFTLLLLVSCNLGVEPVSTNCNLAKLYVDSGDLSPSFSPDTTQYTLALGNDISSLNISATPEETKASVSITPGSPLSLSTGDQEVKVVVTAPSGVQKEYKIMVNRALDSKKTIDSFGFPGLATGTINQTDHTIKISLPYGTDTSQLRPDYTTTGARVTVGNVEQQSGISTNDFTNQVSYIVYAEDGSTCTYLVSVTIELILPSDNCDLSGLIVSSGSLNPAFSANQTQYALSVDHSINSLSITATAENDAASVQILPSSPASLTVGNQEIKILVTAEDGTEKTYSLDVYRAENDEKAITSFQFSNLTVTGNIDQEKGTIDVSVPFGTEINALKASFLTSGESVWVGSIHQQSGITANDFTHPVSYTVYAEDGTTKTYTITVTRAGSSEKALTAFNFPDLSVTGNINQTDHTVELSVPYGTDVTSLQTTFSTSGETVTVSGITQYSGVSSNNFNSPVTYLVQANDGSTQPYTVTVTILPSDNADLATLSVGTGTLVPAFSADHTEYTLSVDHEVTSLNVSATADDDAASVIISPTSPVALAVGEQEITVTVTAADGTQKPYAITVERAASAEKALTTFSFSDPNVTASIDQTAHTVSLTLPYGTDLSSLKADFAISGEEVTVGGITQTSGATANDFSSAVTYLIHAENGSTQPYVVTVNIAAPPIFAVSFHGNAVGVEGIMADQNIAQDDTAHLILCTYGLSNYHFVGWAETSGGTILYTDEDFFTMGDGPVDLYAQWQPVSGINIVLTLPSADDLVLGHSDRITRGDSLEITAPAGFESYAWYLNGELLSEINTANWTLDTSAAGMDLTADTYELALFAADTDGNEFSGNTYFTVTDRAALILEGNGGTDADGKTQVKYPWGIETVNLACPFTRDGYSFIGWSELQTGPTDYAVNAAFSPGGDDTLYARWLPDTVSPAADFDYTLTDSEIELGQYTGTDTRVEIPAMMPVDGLYYPVTSTITGTASTGTFAGNADIIEVILPDGFITLGSSTFHTCSSLTSIYISKSVSTIETTAVYYCIALPGINVDTENPYFTSSDGILFNKDKTELIQYPLGKTSEDYNIPITVETIKEGAFANNMHLLNISCEGNLQTIEPSAFVFCSLIESITLPDSVRTIEGGAFLGCSALTSITIPNLINTLGESSFCSCRSLETISLPSEISELGNAVFFNCTLLGTVILNAETPPSVGNSILINTASNLAIHVPADSVAAYQAAAGWSEYADKITAIE